MANFIERLLNGEKKTLHKLEKIADAVRFHGGIE